MRGSVPIPVTRRALSLPNARAADLDVPADVARALDGIDAVVQAASSPFGDRDSEVRYVRNVAAACAHVGAHVVYVSVINVDRNTGYPYYRAKAEAERALAAGGAPYTIVRAAQFHPFVDYLCRLLTKPPIAVIPRRAAFQPLDVGACAERLADLAMGAPLGRARDIAGPQILDAHELVADWMRAHGRRRPILELPLPLPGFREFAGRRLINPNAEPLGPSFDAWLSEHGSAPNPYQARG